MASCTQTKIKNAGQLLQGLTLCEKPLDIPGNFRAKQRRSKHDDSKLVFPNPRKKESDTYKTHYNHQFRSKPNARPSSARPCSPTRRNNPHPSKNFLNWRIPTRIFDYGKVKNANVSFLKSNIEDSHQRFYDDYSGKQENEHEVDARQLMQIAKSYAAAVQKERKNVKKHALPGLQKMKRGERITLGLSSPPNSPVGIKFPTVLRNSWSPEQSSDGCRKPPTKAKLGGKKPKSSSPPQVHSRPHFTSWYDVNNANRVEGIQTENEEVDESNIEMALGALKPEALAAIEQWLLSASDEERQIAMKFIEAIILASVENSNISTQPSKRVESPIGAVPQQFLAPYPGFQNATTNAHHHNHNMRRACEVCKKKELESALQQLQTIASLPMDVPAITELLNPLHPALHPALTSDKETSNVCSSAERKLNRPWQDRSRHETKYIANKGSLFMNSKRPKGRHFTIHPEWN